MNLSNLNLGVGAWVIQEKIKASSERRHKAILTNRFSTNEPRVDNISFILMRSRVFLL